MSIINYLQKNVKVVLVIIAENRSPIGERPFVDLSAENSQQIRRIDW